MWSLCFLLLGWILPLAPCYCECVVAAVVLAPLFWRVVDRREDSVGVGLTAAVWALSNIYLHEAFAIHVPDFITLILLAEAIHQRRKSGYSVTVFCGHICRIIWTVMVEIGQVLWAVLSALDNSDWEPTEGVLQDRVLLFELGLLSKPSVASQDAPKPAEKPAQPTPPRAGDSPRRRHASTPKDNNSPRPTSRGTQRQEPRAKPTTRVFRVPSASPSPPPSPPLRTLLVEDKEEASPGPVLLEQPTIRSPAQQASAPATAEPIVVAKNVKLATPMAPKIRPVVKRNRTISGVRKQRKSKAKKRVSAKAVALLIEGSEGEIRVEASGLSDGANAPVTEPEPMLDVSLEDVNSQSAPVAAPECRADARIQVEAPAEDEEPLDLSSVGSGLESFEQDVMIDRNVVMDETLRYDCGGPDEDDGEIISRGRGSVILDDDVEMTDAPVRVNEPSSLQVVGTMPDFPSNEVGMDQQPVRPNDLDQDKEMRQAPVSITGQQQLPSQKAVADVEVVKVAEAKQSPSALANARINAHIKAQWLKRASTEEEPQTGRPSRPTQAPQTSSPLAGAPRVGSQGQFSTVPTQPQQVATSAYPGRFGPPPSTSVPPAASAYGQWSVQASSASPEASSRSVQPVTRQAPVNKVEPVQPQGQAQGQAPRRRVVSSPSGLNIQF